MKIFFAGTPEFALPTLEMLAKTHEVVGVATPPDKPAGRGLKLIPSPVKILAQKLKLPLYEQPINELGETITKSGAEVVVVAAYGKLVSEEILAIPPKGVINIHPSLLPKYRGASPIQGPILNGDSESGTTIMKMVKKLDAGPIIAQEKIKLLAGVTAGELHDTLSTLSAELLKKVLAKSHPSGDRPEGEGLQYFREVPQDHSKATFTEKITPKDAKLNIKEPAEILEKKVRAYNPWPGAYIKNLPGTFGIVPGSLTRLKIFKSHVSKSKQNNIPALQCGDKNYLILEEVQPEGKKKMSGEDFMRGLPEPPPLPSLLP